MHERVRSVELEFYSKIRLHGKKHINVYCVCIGKIAKLALCFSYIYLRTHIYAMGVKMRINCVY